MTVSSPELGQMQGEVWLFLTRKNARLSLACTYQRGLNFFFSLKNKHLWLELGSSWSLTPMLHRRKGWAKWVDYGSGC